MSQSQDTSEEKPADAGATRGNRTLLFQKQLQDIKLAMFCQQPQDLTQIVKATKYNTIQSPEDDG